MVHPVSNALTFAIWALLFELCYLIYETAGQPTLNAAMLPVNARTRVACDDGHNAVLEPCLADLSFLAMGLFCTGGGSVLRM
jgi:hypothetical protein